MLASGLTAAGASDAFAQTRAVVPTIDPANKDYRRIRDPAGKPCVTLKGTYRQSAIIPSEIDHLILAENGCSKRIKVKACYLETTRCVDFELGSYDKKQVLLGTMSNMPDFRFDFTEKAAF